jgi:hypothetical protein
MVAYALSTLLLVLDSMLVQEARIGQSLFPQRSGSMLVLLLENFVPVYRNLHDSDFESEVYMYLLQLMQ